MVHNTSCTDGAQSESLRSYSNVDAVLFASILSSLISSSALRRLAHLLIGLTPIIPFLSACFIVRLILDTIKGLYGVTYMSRHDARSVLANLKAQNAFSKEFLNGLVEVYKSGDKVRLSEYVRNHLAQYFG